MIIVKLHCAYCGEYRAWKFVWETSWRRKYPVENCCEKNGMHPLPVSRDTLMCIWCVACGNSTPVIKGEKNRTYKVDGKYVECRAHCSVCNIKYGIVLLEGKIYTVIGSSNG